MAVEVDIRIDSTPGRVGAHVTAVATVDHQITTREQTSFGLDHDHLTQAVADRLGRTPAQVYLHDPTEPYGELYRTHQWTPVHVRLHPPSTRILSLSSSDEALMTQTIDNPGDTPHTVTVDFGGSYTRTTSVGTDWSQAGLVEVDEPVLHQLSAADKSPHHAPGVVYHLQQAWGESKPATWPTKLPVPPTQLVLGPGERWEATLLATRISAKVRVDHRASVYGQVVAAFDEPVDGHRLWAIPVDDLLPHQTPAEGLPINETIVATTWAHARIVLRRLVGQDAEHVTAVAFAD